MNFFLFHRSKWSVLLGNLFEHYDAALFSLLSPFLASLFFSDQEPVTALISTYCLIPLGMIARPLGSLVFGYIGDKHGRKEALMLSLLGMALITGTMGFLPTYHQVGILAPILLSISRLFQNFFSAGETMGGAIYLMENSSESQKNFVSSLYSASTIAGILLASGGISLLCAFNLLEGYWRMLYFSGCLTAIFATYFRSNTLLKSIVMNFPANIPVKSIFKSCWDERRALVAIAITSGFSYASYTLSLVLLNGFAPLVSSVSQAEMMHLNTFLLGLDFLLLPCFGLLANRFSREKMMIMAGVLALISSSPLFYLLQGASLLTVILIRVFFVLIGVWFSAPLHAWLQSLLPTSQRYTLISLGYALGSQLLGSPSAAVSLWLFQKTGWSISVGWYWMSLGILASYCVANQRTVQEENMAISLSLKESA